ncbi:hypothetical protein [Mycolicibacterium phlei]|uniref:hypothetical protein n=1 Tax=Mycolicibacterium phlei TaxID=1771 RepID=UPI001040C2FE|nr:hypothetical protein [Mycolicibacterium phlei]
MLASQKMAKRVELYNRLKALDRELKVVFGRGRTNRASAAARQLLRARAVLREEMQAVGYVAWDLPEEFQHLKASNE